MESYTNSLKTLLYTALTCVACSAHGSSNDDLFFDANNVPVVLSAAKLPQLQTEAPATITIIDRALIEASGATQIAEVFRLVPGMQVGYARGNFPVVAYQGLTSSLPQGVQIIIDGSSVYSPLFGGVLWNNLPVELDDIERIEVVRGPNSATFGANAFQSVINITTTHPSQQSNVNASYRLGNQHDEFGTVRFAKSLDKLDYRINLSRSKSEGYDGLNDDLSKQHISSRIDYRLDNKASIQINLSANDSLRQSESTTAALLSFDPKRNRNESSQFAQLSFNHELDTGDFYNSSLSFQHFDGKDKYFAPALGETVDITGESSRWNLDFQHRFQWSQNSRLSWGAGAIYETVYAPFRMNTQRTRSNQRYRIFSNIETRFNENLIFNYGGLYEYDKLSGDNVSPRVALNYLPSPQHSYRISASSAFRTPVITEEYRSSFIGPFELERSAGDLGAETVESVEIGYHGLFLANTVTLDVKLSQNNYDKLINTALSGPILEITDNTDSAHTRSFETELNYRPNSYFLLHAGYAYTNVTHSTNELKNSIPKHNLNILVSQQLNAEWKGSIAYYFMSDMQYLGSQNSPQDTFQRLDLSISKQLSLSSKKSFNVKAIVQLALDKNIDFHEQATVDNRIFLEVGYRVE
jgi:iron complex outermembrane receptor protein